MPYVPQPIDISAHQLPPALDALAERLAENAHDLWAATRPAPRFRSGRTSASSAN